MPVPPGLRPMGEFNPSEPAALHDFINDTFLEWTARIPRSLKLRGGEGKYVFKKALEPQLPPDILYRPKMGFAVPLASWFRGPLRDRVRTALTSHALRDTGMFDMVRLGLLIDQHQSGVSDHSAVLWSLLMFESFLRQVHAAEPRHESAALPHAAAESGR